MGYLRFWARRDEELKTFDLDFSDLDPNAYLLCPKTFLFFFASFILLFERPHRTSSRK